MRRLALIGVVFGLALPGARAEQAATYAGHEIAVVSVERVKQFRDLKAKDGKKHDLAIVVLELRWKGDERHVLIRDKDLAVRDARGSDYDCLLKFVQASAEPEDGPTHLEVPFQVKADAALVSVRVGKTLLEIDSPASVARP